VLNQTKIATVVAALVALTLCGCIRRSLSQARSQAPPAPVAPVSQTGDPATSDTVSPPININTASAEELQKLPGIGEAMAARIIEHREKYGPFRRPEHLMMVRGISDRRFRRMKELITVQ
jgi:competence protein ComEA